MQVRILDLSLLWKYRAFFFYKYAKYLTKDPPGHPPQFPDQERAVLHPRRGETRLWPDRVNLQHDPDCLPNPLQVVKSKKPKNANKFSQPSLIKNFTATQGINVRKDQRASALVICRCLLLGLVLPSLRVRAAGNPGRNPLRDLVQANFCFSPPLALSREELLRGFSAGFAAESAEQQHNLW